MPVWDIVIDGGSIPGTVWGIEWNAQPFLQGGDGDWIINLTPDPDFAHFATNRAGDLNYQGSENPPAGIIQCEIQPRDNTKATFDLLMGDLPNQHVIVAGPYVEDNKHSGPNGGGRTEIHPITQVFVTYGDTDPYTTKLKLLVFSDASTISPIPIGKTEEPPYAHTNRLGSFQCVWPPPPAPDSAPVYQVHELLGPENRRYESVTQLPPPERPSLRVEVETGTPDAGQGMYGAIFTLSWISKDLKDGKDAKDDPDGAKGAKDKSENDQKSWKDDGDQKQGKDDKDNQDGALERVGRGSADAQIERFGPSSNPYTAISTAVVRHFIAPELRPDLVLSALRLEPDMQAEGLDQLARRVSSPPTGAEGEGTRRSNVDEGEGERGDES